MHTPALRSCLAKSFRAWRNHFMPGEIISFRAKSFHSWRNHFIPGEIISPLRFLLAAIFFPVIQRLLQQVFYLPVGAPEFITRPDFNLL